MKPSWTEWTRTLGRAFDDTDDQDLELDLGLDEEDHAGMAAAREVADELDFSDIEDLLEDSDAAEAEATDTGELELDLDLDLDEEPTTEDADIYDIAETQPTESADEDLAFELEDDEIEDLDGFGETIILAPEEQRAAVEAAHGDRPRPPAAPVRRARDREFHAIDRVEPKANARLGKPILIVILLALLGAGLFVATRVLNIHIPFLSGLTSTQAPDPGNVNFSTFGINSMFVDNQKLDKLFVISGKIRNDYPTARKAVKIDGKLYAKGKKLAATEAVYAGNVISGPDLAVIDKDGIQQRLSKPDTTVAAGEVASFMVIFTNLPDDLEEFTIEVASSSE